MDVVSQPLSECFARTKEVCEAAGATVVEVPTSRTNSLGLQIARGDNQWTISVDCSWPRDGSLPAVYLENNERLLAHVSCHGWVCVNDSESLSINLSRHADTVAETVLAAVSLLEHSLDDSKCGYVEFFNELEGYWSNRPETLFGRTAVEVDGRSRPVACYADLDSDLSNLNFLGDSSKPPEFPTAEARVYRAAYFALPRAILPPEPDDDLTVSYLDHLYSEFDSTQQTLWTKLVGNSSKAERVAILVSMPRAAGGLSLIGFTFGVVNGSPDVDAPIASLLIMRHTATHMRERGGADLSLGSRHVVIFGCGSIGSEVADALATSGVGNLTLVDPQLLSADNVFRHALGRFWVGTSKARALQATLPNRYPGVEITAYVEDAYRWLLANPTTKVDGFIVALGMPTLERQLSRAIRLSHPKTPVVYTWLEPLDLGGHAVAVTSSGQGCLDCLYRDDEGADSLSSRTSYLEPGQTLTRNLTGCASTFTPYGAIQSRRTALLAAEQMLKALSGSELPHYAYWTGDGSAAAAHGLRTTSWWRQAKTNSSVDVTRSMFGSACKQCRPKR